MALKITLKPGEKFVINGAVVVNADRRTSLLIQNKVSILREKDVMLPTEANTPVKRIYFDVMMMYLDDAAQSHFMADFTQRMTEFMDAISNREALQKCVSIVEDVNAGRFYGALMTCKKLLPFEKERLEYVGPREPLSAASS